MGLVITQDNFEQVDSGNFHVTPSRRTFRFYTVYAVHPDESITHRNVPQTKLRALVAELIRSGYKVRSEEECNLTGDITPNEISQDHIATPIPYKTKRSESRDIARHNKIQQNLARKRNNKVKVKEVARVYLKKDNSLIFVGDDNAAAAYVIDGIRKGFWRKTDFVIYFTPATCKKYGLL